MIFVGINFYVVFVGGNEIKDDVSIHKADCILVLGAAVRPNGEPSPMLKERLDKGIELYFSGKAKKLLLSGDNGQVNYNEVKAMYKYVHGRGVAPKDIFLDHAGFSTYDSMYRARDVFNAKKIIIVTQKYHLYRAVYIAKELGLDVEGAKADKQRYIGQSGRDFREILARDKDFLKCITKPKPKYLGEVIDIKGDGNKSH
ncbi:MAG: ElyC/SanA/YdcF family protein [Anaerovoracaceae bacterium]